MYPENTSTFIPANSKQVAYVKVKPSKTSYIKLSSEDDGCGKIIFCNEKRTALSASCNIDSRSSFKNQVIFAVKMGVS